MRIGIFGGTFDPPHNGHYKYACEAIEKFSLDRLIVVPASIPPHKAASGVLDSADRLKMVGLLFGDDSRFEINDMELKRNGKSYTVDTVKELREIYPNDELIFLVGSDMLLSFHKWKAPEEIIKYVRIGAVSRCNEVAKTELEKYVEAYFSDSKDRFIICDFDPVELSSTQVRDAVENGESVASMVNPQIEAYIKEKGLYRERLD